MLQNKHFFCITRMSTLNFSADQLGYITFTKRDVMFIICVDRRRSVQSSSTCRFFFMFCFNVQNKFKRGAEAKPIKICAAICNVSSVIQYKFCAMFIWT